MEMMSTAVTDYDLSKVVKMPGVNYVGGRTYLIVAMHKNASSQKIARYISQDGM